MYKQAIEFLNSLSLGDFRGEIEIQIEMSIITIRIDEVLNRKHIEDVAEKLKRVVEVTVNDTNTVIVIRP